MATSLVLGFFDGVHLGHQAVIASAVEYAKKQCSTPILITFSDSPAKFFKNNVQYILSREDSLKKMKEYGIKDIDVYDFSSLACLTADEYLALLIDKYRPISISTGFNHTFGLKKQGNRDFLELNQEKYNYKYLCVEQQEINGEVISSTLIRKLLSNGNISEANFLLNSNFIIKGVVKKGAQIGRTMGFPTANIDYPKEIIQIPFGVYAAKIGGKYAILNWGMRPTVNNIVTPVAEAHILDFEGDLYDKEIVIEVIEKIRNEQKFNSLEELKTQINKDIEVCLKLL